MTFSLTKRQQVYVERFP